jgi:hypothetical protein
MNNGMTIPKTIDIAGHWLSRREFLKHKSFDDYRQAAVEFLDKLKS